MTTPVIRPVIVGQEELRASQAPVIRDLLREFAAGSRSVEITAYVTCGDANDPSLASPHVDLSMDLEVDGVIRMTGFAPDILAAIPRLAAIAAGTWMFRDELGPYPFAMSGLAGRAPGLWRPGQEHQLEALTGMTSEELEPLLLAVHEKRLELARSLYPGLQSRWTEIHRRAVAEAVLL